MTLESPNDWEVELEQLKLPRFQSVAGSEFIPASNKIPTCQGFLGAGCVIRGSCRNVRGNDGNLRLSLSLGQILSMTWQPCHLANTQTSSRDVRNNKRFEGKVRFSDRNCWGIASNQSLTMLALSSGVRGACGWGASWRPHVLETLRPSPANGKPR
eukprot:scaffold1411_cov252-Pinguiococcus_pyrenoidosus.AAC.28